MIHDSNAIYLRTLQLAHISCVHDCALARTHSLSQQLVISSHTYGDIHAPGSIYYLGWKIEDDLGTGLDMGRDNGERDSGLRLLGERTRGCGTRERRLGS